MILNVGDCAVLFVNAGGLYVATAATTKGVMTMIFAVRLQVGCRATSLLVSNVVHILVNIKEQLYANCCSSLVNCCMFS